MRPVVGLSVVAALLAACSAVILFKNIRAAANEPVHEISRRFSVPPDMLINPGQIAEYFGKRFPAGSPLVSFQNYVNSYSPGRASWRREALYGRHSCDIWPSKPTARYTALSIYVYVDQANSTNELITEIAVTWMSRSL